MFKVGEYVVYKREVCKIIDVKEKYYNDTDYYVLQSNSDTSLSISVPSDTPLIKNIMTMEELEELIKRIPNIPIIETDNKMIENIYKELMNSDSYDDLIKIIKTTYLRNKSRIDNHKKVAEKDNYYFEKAENLLYSELSITLGKSYEETKEYFIKKIEEIVE